MFCGSCEIFLKILTLPYKGIVLMKSGYGGVAGKNRTNCLSFNPERLVRSTSKDWKQNISMPPGISQNITASISILGCPWK